MTVALAPAKQRKFPTLKWSNWYLTALKLAVGLLLVLLILLLWLLRQNEAEEQRATLIADVLWLEQILSFRLEGNVTFSAPEKKQPRTSTNPLA
jgi:hypothetical protein